MTTGNDYRGGDGGHLSDQEHQAVMETLCRGCRVEPGAVYPGGLCDRCWRAAGSPAPGFVGGESLYLSGKEKLIGQSEKSLREG